MTDESWDSFMSADPHRRSTAGPTVGRSHNRLHLLLQGPDASLTHLNPSISALNRLSPIFLPFIHSFDGIEPLFLSQMC